MAILQCVPFSGYVPLRRGRLISATWRRTPSTDFQGITFSAELSLEMIHTHVMSVVVIHGVTGIPHHRPSATSVFSHSTYHSAAHTACVMPSVDSIRHESHAAARDVFQPLPTQRRLILVYHWDTINGLVNYGLAEFKIRK